MYKRTIALADGFNCNQLASHISVVRSQTMLNATRSDRWKKLSWIMSEQKRTIALADVFGCNQRGFCCYTSWVYKRTIALADGFNCNQLASHISVVRSQTMLNATRSDRWKKLSWIMSEQKRTIALADVFGCNQRGSVVILHFSRVTDPTDLNDSVVNTCVRVPHAAVISPLPYSGVWYLMASLPDHSVDGKYPVTGELGHQFAVGQPKYECICFNENDGQTYSQLFSSEHFLG